MDFKIYNIRNQQVMLDEDLAKAYEVKTKNLNKAVKRNIKRFPHNFYFQLTFEEIESLRFQNGTSKIEETEKRGGRRYLPYAFTEQGIAMLSAVLRSEKAVEVSIKIINQFIQMRKFLNTYAGILQRIEKHDIKLIQHDKKFDKIFNSLNKEQPKQGIFYDGQIFDAYEFINDLIKTAKNNITLIDNYVNYETLALFKNTKVKILIKTNITEQLKQDYKKYKEQYNNIQLEHFTKSHDRFLILDKKIYHIGASLKDLGKKWFAFSKMLSVFENKELIRL